MCLGEKKGKTIISCAIDFGTEKAVIPLILDSMAERVAILHYTITIPNKHKQELLGNVVSED